jgi:F420-dependent oxidoreductase-like protein
MRFGIHFLDYNIPDGPASYPTVLADTARAAEEVGASWFTVMDHWFQMEQFRTAHDPMMEAYTTLGFLAAHTSTVELGTIVTGVTYRHPGLLAQIVTTLDVLSGGRAVLGIGAAWYEEEHQALGVPFPPVAERFERLEETLQVVHRMFDGDRTPYDGKHYRLAGPLNSPAPVRRPPIMVGGGGERKTLRLVAKYADACNIFASATSGPEAVAHKLEVLRGHCDREGTDYDRIRKTVLWSDRFDPAAHGAAFAEEARRLAAVGVEQVHVVPDNDPVRYVRALGQHVVPALAQL